MDGVTERELSRWQRREIERILTLELNRAKEASRLADLRFREVLQSTPSGIPAPDSNVRIAQVARERRNASKLLDIALERWTNFVTMGVVPEDLLESVPDKRPAEERRS